MALRHARSMHWRVGADDAGQTPFLRKELPESFPRPLCCVAPAGQPSWRVEGGLVLRICRFKLPVDDVRLFLDLKKTCTRLCWRSVCPHFYPLKKLGYSSSYFWVFFKKNLYIFWTQVLGQIYKSYLFPRVFLLSFNFLNGFFSIAKVFNFVGVQFIKFFFKDRTFPVIFKKPLPHPRSQKLSPMFSSQSFKALMHTFRPMRHF